MAKKTKSVKVKNEDSRDITIEILPGIFVTRCGGTKENTEKLASAIQRKIISGK